MKLGILVRLFVLDLHIFLESNVNCPLSYADKCNQIMEMSDIYSTNIFDFLKLEAESPQSEKMLRCEK